MVTARGINSDDKRTQHDSTRSIIMLSVEIKKKGGAATKGSRRQPRVDDKCFNRRFRTRFDRHRHRRRRSARARARDNRPHDDRWCCIETSKLRARTRPTILSCVNKRQRQRPTRVDRHERPTIGRQRPFRGGKCRTVIAAAVTVARAKRTKHVNTRV